MENLICPRCKSTRCIRGYPDMYCRTCGYTEPLFDFPISWEWHRHLCRENNRYDPGPNEISSNSNIEERLQNVEEILLNLSQPELRRLKLDRIYEETKDIRRGLQYTQRLISKSKHPKGKGGKPTKLKAIED